MPITTVFNSDEYIESSLKILSEFITEYIPNITITNKRPLLDENVILEKPILYLEISNEKPLEIGLGRKIGNGKFGQNIVINIMAYWIITKEASNNIDPVLDIIKKSQALKDTFVKHRDELISAGLKNPQISNFRQIPGIKLSGGRQLITYMILKEWS